MPEDDAAAALLKIRDKLLDLTLRNPLLNYRHPSGRSLRVIDEVPNQLFERLVDGDAFELRALPRVPRDGEKIDAKAKEFLDTQPDRHRPLREGWARLHDIDPEYELHREASSESQHSDLIIQTLLFPDELETLLRNMVSYARTAVEESGANVLYLAFGFLEWRDAEYSEKLNLAPLILLPVTLQKLPKLDLRTRKETYRLEFSGEDLQSNISLRERLKKFGLLMPDLEDDDTPGRYFSRCKILIEHKPQWKLHRHVTLGFFQFGKLLMYLDLDPNRWPQDEPISEHALIKQVLEGSSNDDDGSGLDVNIDINDISLKAAEAQLVECADSSQHRAIVCASKGRNLVIEGPPGTGKSQTITNIIGVCLSQGKSVLFVSEKLAALEVVKSRLESAGLGDFCLELHSHKTQKRKFLEDLSKRMSGLKDLDKVDDSVQVTSEYSERREKIAAYLSAIAQMVEGYGVTRQDLFCNVAKLGSSLPVEDLSSLIPDEPPSRLSKPDQAEILNRAKEAEESRKIIAAKWNGFSNHPWFGIVLLRSGEAGNQCRELIGAWYKQAEELNRHAFGPDAPKQTVCLRTLAHLARAMKLFKMLTPTICSRFSVGRLAGQLASVDSVDSQIEEWKNLEECLHQAYEKTSSAWNMGHDSMEEVQAELHQAAEQLAAVCQSLPIKSPSEIQTVKDCVDHIKDEVSGVGSYVKEIQSALDCDLGSGADSIRIILKLMQLAAHRPSSSLTVVPPSSFLEKFRDIERLREFVDRHEDLRSARTQLLLEFDFDDVSEEEIEAAADALDDPGDLYQRKKEWKLANKFYRELCRKRVFFRSSVRRARDLRKILDYLKKAQDFEQDDSHAGLLGPHFRGMETESSKIYEVCTWRQRIRDELGDGPTREGMAGKQLFGLKEGALKVIDQKNDLKVKVESKFLVSEIEKLEGLADELIKNVFEEGWQGAQQRAADLHSKLNHASEQMDKRCKDPSVPLQQSLRDIDTARSLLTNEKRSELQKQFMNTPQLNPWKENEIELLVELTKVVAGFREEDGNSPVIAASVQHSKSTSEEQGKTTRINELYKNYEESRKKMSEICRVDDSRFFGREHKNTDFGSLVDKLKSSLINESDIADWTKMTFAVEKVREITRVSDAQEALLYYEHQDPSAFSRSIDYATLLSVAEYEISQNEILGTFESDKHNELLREFRELDQKLCDVSKRHIVRELLKKEVPAGTSGMTVGDKTELALLKHETGKTKKLLPIRKLVDRAGAALQALKPCFMMGPLSVSQYLPPGKLSFDLIVMDEASQMRPEDSLGAIARGKQLIVVGDPKQLPPTNFFNLLNESDEENEDEELAFGNQESILDYCFSNFGGSQVLNWHYRSQHERLIAFSNHQFYNKSLNLFPTAHASDEILGIEYRRVEGVYRGQTNEMEAQELITDVVREVKSGRGRSIGVVAMNSQQARVLRDTWDRHVREMPEIKFLPVASEDNVLNRLFIKNLENVQGDERDVIFISLTYGRDDNGNFFQRFGPIGHDLGWRRLNVLFTRARQQMRIYSSMGSEMIKPSDQAKRGVHELKAFLEYCETGILPELATKTGRGPDTPFEEDVAAEICRMGLRVEFQVGVAGFYIDIGVFDEREPGHFLLGVECDGATYHSSLSARDRDRIRQEILERLGWRIHRVWSTDWFRSSRQERDKLRRAIGVAKAEADERAIARESCSANEHLDEAVGLFKENSISVATSKVDSDVGENNLERRLADLRLSILEEFPEVPEERCLLNDRIIATLINQRPTTLEEFQKCIPLETRQAIEPAQSRRYLRQILLMLEPI